MAISEALLNRLDDKLDRLDARLDSVSLDLKEHMRRTQIAEDNIDHLRAQIKPLEAHVMAWGGVGKAVGVIAALATVGAALFKVLGH